MCGPSGRLIGRANIKHRCQLMLATCSDSDTGRPLYGTCTCIAGSVYNRGRPALLAPPRLGLQYWRHYSVPGRRFKYARCPVPAHSSLLLSQKHTVGLRKCAAYRCELTFGRISTVKLQSNAILADRRSSRWIGGD
jgi:hypothetical protein